MSDVEFREGMISITYAPFWMKVLTLTGGCVLEACVTLDLRGVF